MNRPARFTPADIKRAIQGAQRAGLTVGGVEIAPDGRIVVLTDRKIAAEDTPDAALARWMAANEGQHDRH